jgi:hypothetical protein
MAIQIVVHLKLTSNKSIPTELDHMKISRNKADYYPLRCNQIHLCMSATKFI